MFLPHCFSSWAPNSHHYLRSCLCDYSFSETGLMFVFVVLVSARPGLAGGRTSRPGEFKIRLLLLYVVCTFVSVPSLELNWENIYTHLFLLLLDTVCTNKTKQNYAKTKQGDANQIHFDVVRLDKVSNAWLLVVLLLPTGSVVNYFFGLLCVYTKEPCGLGGHISF